ncbi:unnamed protein product [Echinostoma caproni]|uniref:Uncharacterized protein n=1 Tax=Echinostoma caproni TaxID=27848 RepID=A0A183AAF0_9TREM|nr:unnamed protein product [Echinostoma caproni]
MKLKPFDLYQKFYPVGIKNDARVQRELASQSLPSEERRYYLPSRTTLELPWDCLIARLRDLSAVFDSARKKSEKRTHNSPLSIHSGQNIDTSALHSIDTKDQTTRSSCEIPIKSVTRIPHKGRSVIRDHTESLATPGLSDPVGAAKGGLGWMPSRSSKCRRLDKSSLEPAPLATDDPDVLNAVPELSTSRLVGDHYFLNLSDSDEDVEDQEEYGTSSSAKRSSTGRKGRGRPRDPDPTWSAPSPSTKRSGVRITKGSDLLLSPANAKACLPTSALTGGRLACGRFVGDLDSRAIEVRSFRVENLRLRMPVYFDRPLLIPGVETPSLFQKTLDIYPHSFQSLDPQSSTTSKQSKTKTGTTVRQRLAKRLGL